MVSALFLATLLTFTDPAGDASGDGSLSYPTAEIFRAPGTMDVRELYVYDESSFAFSVSLAQITNPLELPHGFSLPIIEIYVNTREAGGRSELLPGSGMRLPDGVVWNYVFRITGESVELLYADPDTDALVDVSEAYRVTLTLEDTTLFIGTTLPRPRHFSLYGVVGSYDFWDPTRWRRVRPEAEAFAFGSPSQAASDVRAVDVLAPSQEAQVAAIQTGILPEIRSPNQQGRWLAMMASGLVVALLGSAGRVYAGYRARPKLRPTIGFGSQLPTAEPEMDAFASSEASAASAPEMVAPESLEPEQVASQAAEAAAPAPRAASAQPFPFLPALPALPAPRPARPPKQVPLEDVDSWDIWLEEGSEDEPLPIFERERYPLKETKRP